MQIRPEFQPVPQAPDAELVYCHDFSITAAQLGKKSYAIRDGYNNVMGVVDDISHLSDNFGYVSGVSHDGIYLPNNGWTWYVNIDSSLPHFTVITLPLPKICQNHIPFASKANAEIFAKAISPKYSPAFIQEFLDYLHTIEVMEKDPSVLFESFVEDYALDHELHQPSVSLQSAF